MKTHVSFLVKDLLVFLDKQIIRVYVSSSKSPHNAEQWGECDLESLEKCP